MAPPSSASASIAALRIAILVRVSDGEGVKATLQGWMCEGWITCLPERPSEASSQACL